MKSFCSCSFNKFYLVLIFIYFVQIESKSWLKPISHFQSRIPGPGINFLRLNQYVSTSHQSLRSVCYSLLYTTLLSSIPIIVLVQIHTLFYFSDCHCILASWFPSLFPFTSTCTSQNVDKQILLKIRKVHSSYQKPHVIQSL